MTTMTFEDVAPVADTVPELDGVDYPCQKLMPNGELCGREAGPYGGRGPKPKVCPDHKRSTSSRSGPRAPRVTGSASNLAAQAAGVLVQLNGLVAIGLMAVGLKQTASALGSCSDTFESQAYDALLTDPDLCKLILRGGIQSSRMSLGLAYVGVGSIVVPTAVNELREKKAERLARMEEMNPEG